MVVVQLAALHVSSVINWVRKNYIVKMHPSEEAESLNKQFFALLISYKLSRSLANRYMESNSYLMDELPGEGISGGSSTMCTNFKIEVAMAVSAFFDSIADILLEEMHQVSSKHSDIVWRM